MTDYIVIMAIIQAFIAAVVLLFSAFAWDDAYSAKSRREIIRLVRVGVILLLTIPLGAIIVPIGAVGGAGYGLYRLIKFTFLTDIKDR